MRVIQYCGLRTVVRVIFVDGAQLPAKFVWQTKRFVKSSVTGCEISASYLLDWTTPFRTAKYVAAHGSA